MICAFKKNAGQSCLKAQNEFLNNKLSSARMKSEYCIGLIKNRFPCLCGLKIRIQKARDVKQAVHIFTVCIILLNLLLSEPDIPEQWYEQCEEDIGVEVDRDALHGRDLCLDDENRREQVKHTLN